MRSGKDPDARRSPATDKGYIWHADARCLVVTSCIIVAYSIYTVYILFIVYTNHYELLYVHPFSQSVLPYSDRNVSGFWHATVNGSMR